MFIDCVAPPAAIKYQYRTTFMSSPTYFVQNIVILCNFNLPILLAYVFLMPLRLLTMALQMHERGRLGALELEHCSCK